MTEETSLAVVTQSFLKSSPLFQKKELQLNEAHIRSGPPPPLKKKPQRLNKDNWLKPSEGKEEVPVKKQGLFWLKKKGPIVKPYQGIGMKLVIPDKSQEEKKKASSPVKFPTQQSKASILYQLTNGHNSPPVTRRSKLEQIMQNKQRLTMNPEEESKVKGRPLPQVPKLVSNSNRDSIPHTYAYPDFKFSSKKHNSHPAANQSSSSSRKYMERSSSAGSIRQASSEPQLPKTASSPVEHQVTILKSVSSADLPKANSRFLQFDSVDDDEYFQMVETVKPYSVVPFSSPITDKKQQQDQKGKKEAEDDDDDDDDSYIEMHPGPSGYTYIDSHPAPEMLDDEEGEYQYVDMNKTFYQTGSSSVSPKMSAKFPLRPRNSSAPHSFSPTNNVTKKLGSVGDDDDIYY